MSRLRTISLSVAAVSVVAAAGFLVAPANAAPGSTAVVASTTAYPTSPPPTSPSPTSPSPTSPPPTTQPPGHEGCTPGFWKNHPEAFAGTGYATTTTLGSVFSGLPASYASLTFQQALDLGGGGLNALLRQAVAALLNASSPDVDYPLSAADVIAQTNAAIASGNYDATKDLFDQFNNLTAPGFCD